MFLAGVHLDQHYRQDFDRRLSLLHASDHLDRLLEACLEREEPLFAPEIVSAAQRLTPEFAEVRAWLSRSGREDDGPVRHLAAASARQAEERRRHRARLLEETAAGKIMPDETQQQLEAMRWVDRIGYHAWRAVHHLAGVETAADSQVYDEPESS